MVAAAVAVAVRPAAAEAAAVARAEAGDAAPAVLAAYPQDVLTWPRSVGRERHLHALWDLRSLRCSRLNRRRPW